MTQEQKEAFIAVQKINEELSIKYTKLNNKDIYKDWLSLTPILSITIADSMTFINLSIPYDLNCEIPEFNIYSSENNDRIFYEKGNKYESFYKFIKRKFLEIKEVINSVKL